MPPITSFLKYKEKANSELHKETARNADFVMAGHVLGMIGQLVDPDDLRDQSPENVKLWNEICTIASPMWKDDGKGKTFHVAKGPAMIEKHKQQLEWEKNAKNLNKVVNLITDNFESVCRESFANADSSSWLNNSSIAYFIYKGLPRLCNFFELDVHFLPDELAKTYNKVAQEKNKPLLWDVPAEERVPFVPNAGAKDKADPEVKKETWKPRNQFAKVIAGVENEMDMVGMDHRDIERARSIREKVNPIYYNDKKILKGLEASFADITAKHRVTGAGGSTTKHDNMKKSITDVMKMLRNNREHPVSLSQKLKVLEKARDMTDIYIAAKTEGHENDPTWEPTSQMGKRRLKGARKALAILNEEIEHLKLFKAGLVQPEVSYNEFLTASEASKVAPDADKKSFAGDHLFIGTALDSETVVSKEKLKAVRGYKPAKKAEAKKGMDYREWCRKFPKEPKDVDEEELSPI